MPTTEILRYTAFSTDPAGGNPAGVVLDAGSLRDEEMQRIAAEVDYAETAFLLGEDEDGTERIRYFSPIAEVPFCGHATVAAAVALVDRDRAVAGDTVRFRTPVGIVPITTIRDDAGVRAAFTSIPPTVTALPAADLGAVLDLVGLTDADLDPLLPPRLAHAGNPHPVIVVADRGRFDGVAFDPDAARALMDDRGWPATITVLRRLTVDRFVARNIFPVGRIVEDPATGSAAAAVGGYLRALAATGPLPARVVVEQGAHVGRPGILTVDIPDTGGIVVSGHAVPIV